MFALPGVPAVAPDAVCDLWFVIGLPGEIWLRECLCLAAVCGRCGFLSLRDPTTRWMGHPP